MSAPPPAPSTSADSAVSAPDAIVEEAPNGVQLLVRMFAAASEECDVAFNEDGITLLHRMAVAVIASSISFREAEREHLQGQVDGCRHMTKALRESDLKLQTGSTRGSGPPAEALAA